MLLLEKVPLYIHADVGQLMNFSAVMTNVSAQLQWELPECAHLEDCAFFNVCKKLAKAPFRGNSVFTYSSDKLTLNCLPNNNSGLL